MKLLLCGIAFILLGSSCTQPRYIYSQSTRNLHMFREKGEVKLSASVSTGPNRGLDDGVKTYNRGYDAQAAFALSDHVAVMASYYAKDEKDRIQVSVNTPAVSEVRYDRHGGEIGASFFVPVDKRAGSFFHVDAGYGLGTDRFTDKGTFDTLGLTRNFSNDTRRFFLQPGLYVGSEELRFAMGVRMQWVMYRSIQTDYTQAELAAYTLSGLNEVFTLEPYAVLRIVPSGLPWLGFEVQGSFATVNKNYYIRGGYVSFGLIFMPKGIRK